VVRYRVDNNLGKIEPHLYKKYNAGGIDSNASMSKGKLHFTLRYTGDNQMLSVIISKAEIFNSVHGLSGDLPATPVVGGKKKLSISSMSSLSAPNSPNVNKPDTYVRIQLLPDNKKRKYQTKIQRKTYTPAFDERFQFQLAFDELQNKTLYLSHFEFGRFSKHELIGTVRLNDLHLIKDLGSTDIDLVKNLIPLAEVRK
jgi:Ca2+-dependent lipid-binding protein